MKNEKRFWDFNTFILFICSHKFNITIYGSCFFLFLGSILSLCALLPILVEIPPSNTLIDAGMYLAIAPSIVIPLTLYSGIVDCLISSQVKKDLLSCSAAKKIPLAFYDFKYLPIQNIFNSRVRYYSPLVLAEALEEPKLFRNILQRFDAAILVYAFVAKGLGTDVIVKFFHMLGFREYKFMFADKYMRPDSINYPDFKTYHTDKLIKLETKPDIGRAWKLGTCNINYILTQYALAKFHQKYPILDPFQPKHTFEAGDLEAQSLLSSSARSSYSI